MIRNRRSDLGVLRVGRSKTRAPIHWLGVPLLAACAATGRPASIDDVAIGARAGYSITAVDGAAPERASSTFLTRVPYVLVEPGSRRLELERALEIDGSAVENGERPAQLTLDVAVQSGRSYILRWDGSAVVLVER
ncbi:MAG: hypothetical protein NXI31_13485 [bacterium]|nr:hypothetical protein [bacterium]